MRPFIDKAQDVPGWGPKALQPHTRLGIGVRHAVLKLITSPGVRSLTQRFAPSGADLPELPEYTALPSVDGRR